MKGNKIDEGFEITRQWMSINLLHTIQEGGLSDAQDLRLGRGLVTIT